MKPNRVTYQLCHSLSCQQGDMTTADKIEKMLSTSFDSSLPEVIYFNKLNAAITKKDEKLVDKILSEMKQADISESVEYYKTLACAYGSSGNDIKFKECINEATANKIKLDDEDVFKVMIACCEGGLRKEAESLCKMLPKRNGYIRSLRQS